MFHMIVIFCSVVAVSVYIGKTLARDRGNSRKFKIMIDILLILVLIILAIGLGGYVYEQAYNAGLEAGHLMR